MNAPKKHENTKVDIAKFKDLEWNPHLNIPEMTSDVVCKIAKLQCDDFSRVGHG